MTEYLEAELKKSPRFKCWPFWYVTTEGGHDPRQVSAEWTPVEVFDHYYALKFKGLLSEG